MELATVMKELESLGDSRTKATLQRHGAPEDFFGVKVGDLKKIVKKIKVDQPLAEELFATGNGDAMYLAGLISDPRAVKITVLRRWAKSCDWPMASEYSVAGVAADSPHGWKLGLEWIDSKKESIACTGWSTLSGVVAVTPDEDLDLPALRKLLDRVRKSIHDAPNRVRYTMNGFVIAVGAYVEPLSEHARSAADSIGRVEVDMGGTACKVPFAPESIDKIATMGRIGKKRKTARC